MICVTNCGDDGLTKGVEIWFKKSSNSGEKCPILLINRVSMREEEKTWVHSKDFGSTSWNNGEVLAEMGQLQDYLP